MKTQALTFFRTSAIGAIAALLVACAAQPKMATTDICSATDTGSGADKALFICVLFEDKNNDGNLCPTETLYGLSTTNKPTIKVNSGAQKLAWQAVTKNADGEHEALGVLYKVAFDPFTGGSIRVQNAAAMGRAVSQPLGVCDKYNGPCIADADVEDAIKVEYKYTIQKWLPKNPPTTTETTVDSKCRPLDPVVRIHY